MTIIKSNMFECEGGRNWTLKSLSKQLFAINQIVWLGKWESKFCVYVHTVCVASLCITTVHVVYVYRGVFFCLSKTHIQPETEREKESRKCSNGTLWNRKCVEYVQKSDFGFMNSNKVSYLKYITLQCTMLYDSITLLLQSLFA